MNVLLLFLAVFGTMPDTGSFARCADAARKLHACYDGRGSLLAFNGGYSTRIMGLLDPRLHPQGGAVCQPGVEEPCTFWPGATPPRPSSWGIQQSELAGTYRYCLTERAKPGHLPIGCLTRADHFTWRRAF